MADTTTIAPPRRGRRPAHSRRPLPLRPRRHKARQRPPSAAALLYRLVDEGDVFKVGRRRYLVAPVDAGLLDEIAAALGAVEDDEDDDPGGGNVEDEGEPDTEDEPDHDDDGVIDGDGSTPWSVAV